MEELWPILGIRFYLPIATGITKYASFIINENWRTTPDKVMDLKKFENSEFFITCWRKYDSTYPLFIVPLKDARVVNNITEKGPCIFIISTRGDYEFQCDDSETCNKLLSLLKKINCKLLHFSDLYKITRFIGSGSFGKVYRGLHILTNQEVIIKAVDKKKVKESNIYTEIEILRKINHPYIIKLYAAYEEGDCISLILEYLRGGELYDRIAKYGNYTEDEAKVAMRRLLLALHFLHMNGIVHRDLKTENLILESPDSPTHFKLIDFGLASTLDSHTIKMRCGSPGYVAPEILQDKPYGTKVDIFSAGIILYTMLYGCAPFRGNNVVEILKKNMKCNIALKRHNMAKISGAAKDLMAWMCCKDPEQRCSAAQAISHNWFYKVNIDSRFSRINPIMDPRIDKKTLIYGYRNIPKMVKSDACSSQKREHEGYCEGADNNISNEDISFKFYQDWMDVDKSSLAVARTYNPGGNQNYNRKKWNIRYNDSMKIPATISSIFTPILAVNSKEKKAISSAKKLDLSTNSSSHTNKLNEKNSFEVKNKYDGDSRFIGTEKFDEAKVVPNMSISRNNCDNNLNKESMILSQIDCVNRKNKLFSTLFIGKQNKSHLMNDQTSIFDDNLIKNEKYQYSNNTQDENIYNGSNKNCTQIINVNTYDDNENNFFEESNGSEVFNNSLMQINYHQDKTTESIICLNNHVENDDCTIHLLIPDNLTKSKEKINSFISKNSTICANKI